MAKEPLWTLGDVAALYGAATSVSAAAETQIYDVNLDSRELRPGSLFVAYKRPNGKDGHDFLPDVLAKGGAAALVEYPCVCDGLPLIKVGDANQALQKLGQAARQRVTDACKIIAITGSVGKTTTRALTAQALTGFGKLHASAQSLNNHWGVPLSLARMPQDTQHAVFEVGMNHTGEITDLVAQIRPHIAIITTIDAAHIGNFADGIDGIARAKAEIFSGLDPQGTAIINADTPQLPVLLAEAKRYGIRNIMLFGRSDKADIRLIDYERQEIGGIVTARYNDEEINFALPMRGEHNALNALASLAAVAALGLDIHEAAASLSLISNVQGRGNMIAMTLPQNRQITVVDDRHNSSPVALTAAIREFAQMSVRGRRILALGDMLELGEQSPDLHRSIAPIIAENPIDLVLSCGPMMAHLHATLPSSQAVHYVNSQAMADALDGLLGDGDAILVKGSRGAQMIHVVDGLNRIGQTA
jgi:UDP-N-acetylmuramoyl-tripeptide--D-alanyl-D-alanine ligase